MTEGNLKTIMKNYLLLYEYNFLYIHIFKKSVYFELAFSHIPIRIRGVKLFCPNF